MDKHLLRFDFKTPILFFDFETQNLNLYKDFDLPWQMGYVLFQGKKIIEKGSSYIWWGDDYTVSRGAAMVTGYSRTKHKSEGRDPVEVSNELLDLMSRAKILGGHNVLGFDIYLLRNLLLKIKGKCPEFTDWRWVDTFALEKAIHFKQVPPRDPDEQFIFQNKMLNTWEKKTPKMKLEDLANKYGIKFDTANLHDALWDIELNVDVWQQTKQNIDI